MTEKVGKTVFVGLSGGVDSAVSAALLQQQGYDVVGVFIRIVVEGYPCTAGVDRVDAMRVAAHLKIPFVEIDFSKEYERQVFDVSIEGFERGETPNPDVLCNRQVKFGTFYEFCKSKGADYIATGHYARVASALSADSGYGDFLAKKSPEVASPSLGKPPLSAKAPLHLLTGADPDKDQSYFLWSVPEEVLRHTLFPVGDKTKTEVRALAKKFGLPNATRADSQGLCFLGPIALEDMLRRELELQPGSVLAESGEVVGSHEGAARYTLGQRHGFTLTKHVPDTPPHYVVGKDIQKNTITISTERFPKHAMRTKLALRETNWIGEAANGPCTARYRYRGVLIPATLDGGTVVLEEPHYVPVGQSLVLYDKDRCLGGGVVDTAELLS
jgi:tRNA-specific 2-thiouridylase